MITQKKLAGNYTKMATKLRHFLQGHTGDTTIWRSSLKLRCIPEKNTCSPCLIQEVTELMVAITKSMMPLIRRIQKLFWLKDRAILLIKYRKILHQ
jgi:hypothetical protein